MWSSPSCLCWRGITSTRACRPVSRRRWNCAPTTPLNFQDVGTIAQLQESFLFWRIATGGPGLPGEAAPWISSMPVWQEFLKEDEIWKVILFLYDYTGRQPRSWANE